MGTFLSDLVLQVLSFVAENERMNIRSRQREGIEAAKARGVKFGRPSAPLPENWDNIYRRWKAKEITGLAAAKACNMPMTSFRYRAEIYEKQGGNTHGKEKAGETAEVHHRAGVCGGPSP